MEFSDLVMPEAVMLGVEACSFTTCTPIQALTLPLTLAGQDVAGQAQTGTGKTAAFLIASMSWVLTKGARSDGEASSDLPVASATIPRRRHRGRGTAGGGGGGSAPRILIIAPTRELVVQIEQEARILGQHTGLNILAVYGGVDYEKQRKALALGQVDLLVGTPGRLIDYFKQKIYHCEAVQSLVIDEADRMFDLGFITDLRYLLRRLPSYEQRLSMLFSATLSYRSQELSYEYMGTPEIISTPMDVKTVHHVTQCLYHIEGKRKISLLVGLLRRDLLDREGPGEGRVIIFTNTKRMGEKLRDWLEANAILSGYLSGDVPQVKRLRVLQRFQAGELPVLIATDLAGRGLHIDGVTHVINFDLPVNPEDYLHRIGRTARAGAKGDAISLVDEEGAYNLDAIELYCGMKIFTAWAADDLLVTLKRPVRPAVSSSRPSHGSRACVPQKAVGDNAKKERKPRRRRRPKPASQGQKVAPQPNNGSSEVAAESAKAAVVLPEGVTPVATAGAVAEPTKKKRRRRRRRSKKPDKPDGLAVTPE